MASDRHRRHDLEQELDELLEVERFEPPEEFAAGGALERPVGLRGGRARPGGLVDAPGHRAARLGRASRDEALDESNPPFYKWFADGKLNASATASTATSRRGAGTASPSTGAARRARSATSPTPSCCADVQRFANALREHGVGKGDVVGIYLPMIPEVVVAMLACARIGAPHNVVFGGFSRRGGAGADGVLRGEGADHRRRRAPQGQDGADQGERSTR